MLKYGSASRGLVGREGIVVAVIYLPVYATTVEYE